MKHDIEQRACDLAVYIIENRTTVRAAAKTVWDQQIYRT